MAGTHKQIWRIAAPAILANSAAPMVGLVDTAIMGHLPSPVHLAAIGIGSTFFSFLFWSFGFLRMSTTGLIAQAYGAQDQVAEAQTMVRAILLALVISIVILLLQGPIFQLGLSALNPPHNVRPFAESYLSIRIWSMPFVLVSYAITGFLIGIGRTKRVLTLQIILNITNLVLNLVFVLGLKMGVAGIALGSLIAEMITAVVGGYLLVSMLGRKVITQAIKDATTWAAAGMRKLIAVNILIFIRTLFLLVAFGYLTRKASALGAVELAATQVLLSFSFLIALGLDGIAYAAETLTGQAKGAGDRDDFHNQSRATFLWALILSIFYAVIFALFGGDIINILTDLKPVRLALEPVMWLVVLTPLIGMPSYQYDGIYIGATASRAMMITMGISLAGYLLVIDWLTNQYGLVGLWGALLIFLALRGVSQAAYYPRLLRAIPSNRV